MKYLPILGRVGAILGVLALIGGLVGYALSYARAAGEVDALQAQREELTDGLRELIVERDSSRAVGDTIGTGASAANAALLLLVEEAEEPADSIRTVIIREESPEAAERALRLDSIRVSQIARLQAVHVQDTITITDLRRQLFADQGLSDRADSIAARTIRNLELQVSAFRRVAQQGWLADLKGNVEVVVAAGTVGALACFFLCPERAR